MTDSRDLLRTISCLRILRFLGKKNYKLRISFEEIYTNNKNVLTMV